MLAWTGTLQNYSGAVLRVQLPAIFFPGKDRTSPGKKRLAPAIYYIMESLIKFTGSSFRKGKFSRIRECLCGRRNAVYRKWSCITFTPGNVENKIVKQGPAYLFFTFIFQYIFPFMSRIGSGRHVPSLRLTNSRLHMLKFLLKYDVMLGAGPPTFLCRVFTNSKISCFRTNNNFPEAPRKNTLSTTFSNGVTGDWNTL